MNDEREKLQHAASTVAACLDMLADGNLDHKDATDVLYMLARVLEHPEVLS